MKPFRTSRHRSPRRHVAVVLVVLGLLAATLGTGISASTAATSSSSETLRIAIPSAFQSVDPNAGGIVRADLSLHSALYSSLTTVNPDLKLVGDLATSWENPTPTTWRFKLRSGATFENGDPLDAKVVVANFDRHFDPNNKLTAASDLKAIIASYTAPDANTVEFTLTGPFLEFPRRLSYVYFGDPLWIPSHNPKLEANASGPYRLASFNPETGAVLAVNPKYYGKAPTYKDVELKVLTTPAARLAALQADEIDASIIIDPQDLPQLKSNKDLKVGAVPATRVNEIRINTTKPPLDNQDVRLALNYAIDKESIVKSLFAGLTTPSKGQVLNELYSGFNPDLKAYSYDPKKAKSLLTKAGYPDGFSVDLDVPTGTYVAGDLAAQAIAAQLSKVGIKVNVISTPFPAWSQSTQKPETSASLMYYGYNPSDNSNFGVLNYFSSPFIQNHADNPTYDSLLATYRTSATEADAKIAIKKATQELHDFAPVVFLWTQPQTYTYSKNVTWKVRPDEWLRAQDFGHAKTDAS